MLSAKPVPKTVRTPDDLEAWLLSQRLSPEPVECVPTRWLEDLTRTPFSLVVLSAERFGRLVLCTGDEVKPFPSEGASSEDDTVLLVCQTA